MSGVVAAGDPATVDAAIAILRKGGNAVDAAIAGATAAFMAEPMLASAGGSGIMTLALSGREPTTIDFFSDMPGRGHFSPDTADTARARLEFFSYLIDFGPTTQEFHIGRGAASVPGALPGLACAHEHFGSLPLTDLVAPAVELAEEGMVTPASSAHVFDLLWGIIASDEDTTAALTNGHKPSPGEVLRNPLLGQVLREFARTGRTPERVFAGMLEQFGHARGGLIGERDIVEYRPLIYQPLICRPDSETHTAWSVFCAPTPGGRLAMRIFYELVEGRPREREPEEILRYARASRAGHAARRHAMVPGATTHISVVDSQGGAAAVTLTNGEGCGRVIPGTGIQLNNFLGEADINPDGFHRHTPGERLPTMMAPAVGLRDQVPALAIGSGGSNRIRSAVGETLYRAVILESSIEDAVWAPRVHAEDDTVWLELESLRDPDAVLEALAGEFTHVRPFPTRDFFFGGVHAAALDSAGRPHGIGDSRRGGTFKLSD